ncbi:tetratricopeptide repeat protein [Leptolyngbya sp. 15MV]|nr:tetratricopeptide repeat protein [Leptolyngbya sp. 15MV]
MLGWTSPTYSYIGQPKEAIRRVERAMRLSPEDPLMFRYHHFLSLAHYVASSWEDAVRWGQSSMQLNPNYTSNLRILAVSLVCLGRADEARAISARLMRVEPGYRVRPYAAASEHDREIYVRRLIEAGFPP